MHHLSCIRDLKILYFQPRTSFGGFPGGSATLRPRTNPSQDFNDDDFLMSGHRSLPRTRRENFPGAHGGPQSDGETRSDGSDRSGGSSADGDMGIPIRVIHERPGLRLFGHNSHLFKAMDIHRMKINHQGHI